MMNVEESPLSAMDNGAKLEEAFSFAHGFSPRALAQLI